MTAGTRQSKISWLLSSVGGDPSRWVTTQEAARILGTSWNRTRRLGERDHWHVVRGGADGGRARTLYRREDVLRTATLEAAAQAKAAAAPRNLKQPDLFEAIRRDPAAPVGVRRNPERLARVFSRLAELERRVRQLERHLTREAAAEIAGCDPASKP